MLAATTVRIDVALEIGAASEEVTVSADAPLLRTESGDLSHNIRTDAVDALPILSIGAAAGSSGIRNPTAVATLLPGAYVVPNTTVKINGAPGNTASYRLEGQDASNGQVPATQVQVQPSVDALQEVTILTSNFAAEYGQVGGGFFNYVVKSGTNQLHGSAYAQILLIEEFARHGVETLFVKSPQGNSPEDHLLVQFQGMIAEYERAQILERSRRGKRIGISNGVGRLSGVTY